MKRASRFAGVLQLSIFAVLASRAVADVALPTIFSDHMVLQRDATVPVWGWAEPGEEVSVSIAGQTKSTKADAKGKWSVKLAKLMAGDALTMTVKGRNSITINDVLVGEVWLCSGQSNMAMTVNRAKDFEKEQAAATLPKIRHFKESSAPNDKPQEKGTGKWEVCSPETVAGFSATAYFFGREVHKAIGVPVGLVNSSVGGTPVEAWTSWEAQKDFTELKPLFESWEQRQATWDPAKAQAAYEKQLTAWKEAAKKAKAAGKALSRPPRKPEEPRIATHHPATLFNGKIAPLVPYAIRGAIWYQGESNAGQGGQFYHLQLSTLVKDWRARWGQGDFPFAWVQLPNYRAPQKEPVEDTGWAMVRESMLKTLALPDTGMAITMDIGEEKDIHPKNKQDVGKRLAMWARAKVYGQKVAVSGPLPAGHKINGDEVTITFKHADGGLVVKIGESLVTPRADSPSVWPEGLGGFGQIRGFAVAGADRKWHRAAAKIVGDTVVVKSSEVKQPVAVRYAWADNPDCNLHNRAGLPASPFRTDHWEVTPPQRPQPKARR